MYRNKLITKLQNLAAELGPVLAWFIFNFIISLSLSLLHLPKYQFIIAADLGDGIGLFKS